MLFSFTSSSPYAQVLDISALRPLFLSPLIGSVDPPQVGMAILTRSDPIRTDPPRPARVLPAP